MSDTQETSRKRSFQNMDLHFQAIYQNIHTQE